MKNLLLVFIGLWNLPIQAQIVKPEEGHYVREIFMEPDTLFFNTHPLFIEPNGGVFLTTNNDTTSFELGTPDYVDGAFVHRTSSTIYIFYGETDMLTLTAKRLVYSTASGYKNFIRWACCLPASCQTTPPKGSEHSADTGQT